jgi:hypothetical protein
MFFVIFTAFALFLNGLYVFDTTESRGFRVFRYIIGVVTAFLLGVKVDKEFILNLINK